MAITLKFTVDDSSIKQLAARLISETEKAVMLELQYLGEELTRYIKDRPASESWIDRTGNLRSSIGYAIFRNGKADTLGGFSQVSQGGEGVSEGEEYVKTLSKDKGQYGLAVVAGMNYASYVEMHEGKDVLASARIKASEKAGSIEKNVVNRVIRAMRR